MMRRGFSFLALMSIIVVLPSCSKKASDETTQQAAEAPAAQQAAPASGPHAVVRLTDGSKVPGTIVASTQTDMIVAGDDGIERKIPLAQVKSVEYGQAQPARRTLRPSPAQAVPAEQAAQPAQPAGEAPAAAPAPVEQPAVTARTYELPQGSQISVRVNEAIDSATAAEGQSYSAQVTRDARDANGDVVIPRGAEARIVITSASKGGRFRGASDLVLGLRSLRIGGREYTVEAGDIGQQGKAGVGANKRTAKFAGGGAALGAIIGAIAGGGKGAAIGAGAGAGAGALTQVLTKGGSIKVPAESVLTFSLDKPLTVTAMQ
jgi:hypothetical protein